MEMDSDQKGWKPTLDENWQDDPRVFPTWYGYGRKVEEASQMIGLPENSTLGVYEQMNEDEAEEAGHAMQWYVQLGAVGCTCDKCSKGWMAGPFETGKEADQFRSMLITDTRRKLAIRRATELIDEMLRGLLGLGQSGSGPVAILEVGPAKTELEEPQQDCGCTHCQSRKEAMN